MRHAAPWLLIVALLAAPLPVLQNRITDIKGDRWYREILSYLPHDRAIKPWLLGFHTTFADYLWIKTILYFGGHFIEDRQYPWLAHMVDIVTKLNPHFYPPYEFAGLMLPKFTNNPGTAKIILQRGLTAFDDRRFEIPFYLGWLYYQAYGDRKMAARYLTLASRHPKSKPYIAGLAATLYRDAGEEETAIRFLTALYYTTEDPTLRTFILEKLKQWNAAARIRDNN